MDVYTTAIRSLAADVASAKEDKAPHLLLRLKQNLQDTQKVSKEQRESAYRLIWQSDLLHVLVGVTRKDYSLVSGGWDMATQLAELLTAVCSGLRPQRQEPGKENSSRERENEVADFYNKLLPTAVDSLLILANNILEHATTAIIAAKSARIRSSRPTLHTFQSVLTSLSYLCANHGECALKTFQSPLTLKMIATSQPQHSLAVVTTLNNLYTYQPPNWLTQTHSMTDVLAYKITVSENDKELQFECLKLLSTFIIPTSLESTVIALTSKYPTLPTTVQDIMEGRKAVEREGVAGERLEQFVRRLKMMMVMMPFSSTTTETKKKDGNKEFKISSLPQNTPTSAQPYSSAETQTASADKEGTSATVIQASWRGHVTRKQLRDTARERKIVAPIQKRYPELKENNVTQIEKELEKKEWYHQEIEDTDNGGCGVRGGREMENEIAMKKQLQSITEMRTFHEKQMSILEQLPAGNVPDFLQSQQNRAATCIQCWWRKKQRRWRQFEEAAITIQRAVRQFLKERHNHKQPRSVARGYNEVVEGEERDQLQAEIYKYQREHFPPQQSEAELRDTHKRVQHLLKEFYSNYSMKRDSTNKRESIESFLSKLDQDCEVLLDAPRLNDLRDISQIDDKFFTGSRTVVRMAQQIHSEEMKASELLWGRESLLHSDH